jgi:hypothetical protein
MMWNGAGVEAFLGAVVRCSKMELLHIDMSALGMLRHSKRAQLNIVDFTLVYIVVFLL